MRPDLARDLVQLSTEHLTLVASAMSMAILLGVPAGILCCRGMSGCGAGCWGWPA